MYKQEKRALRAAKDHITGFLYFQQLQHPALGSSCLSDVGRTPSKSPSPAEGILSKGRRTDIVFFRSAVRRQTPGGITHLVHTYIPLPRNSFFSVVFVFSTPDFCLSVPSCVHRRRRRSRRPLARGRVGVTQEHQGRATQEHRGCVAGVSLVCVVSRL